MDLIQRATKLVASAGGGWLPADDAESLAEESGIAIEQLLLELIPLARRYATPQQSGYRVGAVGQGDSGALYFGANLEIPGCPLNQTVHAEQAVVVMAASHGETGLVRLAVSAAPCGYCRQFLFELATAGELQVLLAHRASTTLTDLLPGAFGPKELGVDGGLLSVPRRNFQWLKEPASHDQSAIAALQAAAVSYAPYTQAFAGAALTTRAGSTYSGPYLENAAFNPSLSPLQAAMVAARAGGAAIEEVAAATLVQVSHSRIDHAAAARLVLDQAAPGVVIQVYEVRVV